MPLTFVPLAEKSAGEAAGFLLGAFRAQPDAPFAALPLLRWKYFDPHPGWNRCRSFAIRSRDTIVAHAGLHPVTFLAGAQEVTALHVIDWASTLPGAGIQLLRKLFALGCPLLTIGGSADTRKILPMAGYRERGTLDLYARVIRPLAQVRSNGRGLGWKTPARLLRNSLWSLAPLGPVPPAWTAERVARFDGASLRVPTAEDRLEFVPARRSASLLNYFLRCPGAAFSGYVIREQGTPRGHFLLSSVARQARISDLWIDAEEPEPWAIAVSLAVRAAAADPAVCEVKAAASTAPARDAIRRNGFVQRGAEPVLSYDPQGALPSDRPLSLTLLDGDGCYLESPGHPYLT